MISRNIFVFISLPLFVFFSFFSYIFIHCHALLSYDPNFKSLAHREVSLKSITKFRPDRQKRKRVNKNMVIKYVSLSARFHEISFFFLFITNIFFLTLRLLYNVKTLKIIKQSEIAYFLFQESETEVCWQTPVNANRNLAFTTAFNLTFESIMHFSVLKYFK